MSKTKLITAKKIACKREREAYKYAMTVMQGIMDNITKEISKYPMKSHYTVNYDERISPDNKLIFEKVLKKLGFRKAKESKKMKYKRAYYSFNKEELSIYLKAYF